jgi:hypothetical protein
MRTANLRYNNTAVKMSSGLKSSILTIIESLGHKFMSSSQMRTRRRMKRYNYRNPSCSMCGREEMLTKF